MSCCGFHPPAVFFLYAACLLASHVGASASDGQMECRQSICGQGTQTLKCTESLILVTGVTSLSGASDDVMLKHVKRACMGKSVCEASELCRKRSPDPVVVSYMCVFDTSMGKTCTGWAIRLPDPHGFLRNPEYPAPGETRCHWRIEAPPRATPPLPIYLTLHDLASTARTQGPCDAGLHISAYTCDQPRKPYNDVLCAGDRGRREGGRTDQLTIVSCGPLDVRLKPTRRSHPFRFWLSYSVKESLREEPVNRTLWDAGLLAECPTSPAPDTDLGMAQPTTARLSVSMATTHTQSVTSASGGSDGGGDGEQDSTMTVLVVLVCVIGFVAIVLTVILIVVCLKRRRPKVELIEHVYAVPGAVQGQSYHPHHHPYPLGDEGAPCPPTPLPRPRLVEPYCDVADSRPPDQQLTPASPAYAEVEEVSDGDVDDRRPRRFLFRSPQRGRPSISSQSGSSSAALYEDINPVAPPPVASAPGPSSGKKKGGSRSGSPVVVKANSAQAKANSAQAKASNAQSKSSSDTSASQKQKRSSVGGGAGTKGGNKASRDNNTPLSGKTQHKSAAKDSPVYVHVVDGVDKSDLKSKSSSKSKPQKIKSGVAPLAAKFSAETEEAAPAKDSSVPRGKTDTYSSRLYPLQEGRVASLVSSLNRNKAKNNGVVSKEQGKVS